MKLIFCNECQDIIKLQHEKRTCMCGKSWGYYEPDGLHAIIGGESIPLGIANRSFLLALTNGRRKISQSGILFDAFVIPDNCDTITKSP